METDDTAYVLEGEPLPPADLVKAIEDESFLAYLADSIYAGRERDWIQAQRARYLETVELHRLRYGDKPAYLIRAPGRLNLFLEYLDVCRGDHMSTTIDGDIPVVVSPSSHDRVRVCNVNPLFPSGEFSIAEEKDRFLSIPWEGEMVKGLADTWEARSFHFPYHGRKRGDWINYIIAPFLRFSHEWPEIELLGSDLTFGPSTIPIRAGTSSSSAVVVLSMMALLLSNRDRLPATGVRKLCRLLGEAEWYVGTRGGANDQTTIFRNEANGILYNLHHLDLIDSKSLPWLEGVGLILCNSLWEADKALGARYNFNMRKGWTDLARDLLKQEIGEAAAQGIEKEDWNTIDGNFVHLGSLDEGLLGVERAVIDKLVDLLPEFITPEAAGKALGKDRTELERDYTLPDEKDTGYKPRNAARFFAEENRIGRDLERLLLEARKRLDKGAVSVESPEYNTYRTAVAGYLDEIQQLLRDDFQVSNSQLELLLSIAGKCPGFLAGKLTGAGSGGCVCILVDSGSEEDMLHWLDRHYFGKEENFTEYRRTLDKLAASPNEEEKLKAEEMKNNLNRALSAPHAQRRVITFSKGATLLTPPATQPPRDKDSTSPRASS